MSSPARRTAIALAASLSFLVLARPAIADEKQACVAASEKAQQLKNAGKLNEAKEQLAVCSRNECPKMIQADCTQWMRDVLDAVPSVVLAAKDKKGRDVVDVTVSIDGKVVASALDGKPITLDPGVHTFRFEAKGSPPYEEQMLVRQSEKNRLVTATFGKPEDGGKDTGGASVSTSSNDRGLPIPAIIVGGLGLAGGGVAVYLGLSADSDGRNLRDTCAPRCTDTQVQDVKDKQNLARIVGVASGVVFAAGVVLLVLHYTTGSKSTASTKPGFTLAPTAGGDATVFRF